MKNSDFAAVWLGQILSQAGTRMYQIAILWWMVTNARAETGKAAALFMVLASLPSIIFVKIVGRLVESAPAKLALLVCDLASFVVVAAVAGVLHYFPEQAMPSVYLAGFLVASLQAVFDPALNKALPEIVAGEDMEAAVAFQSISISLGFYIGALVVAVLVGWVGVAGVVTLNAFSYLLSFAAVLKTRFRHSPPPPPPGFVPETRSGWRILDDYPLVKKVLVGFGMMQVCAVPTFVILPIYVAKTLNADAATLAWVESGLWVSIFVGTLLSRFVPLPRNAEAVGALCIAVLGLGLLTPGLVVDTRALFAAICVQGLAFSLLHVRFMALFQSALPPHAKGRFFALFAAVMNFALPIGHFAAGVLADEFSAPAVCLFQGIGALAVAVYFLVPWRSEVSVVEGAVS